MHAMNGNRLGPGMPGPGRQNSGGGIGGGGGMGPPGGRMGPPGGPMGGNAAVGAWEAGMAESISTRSSPH